MKKKWWGIGLSVGLGAVVLWGAGLPVQADNSGLAAYQAAMKHTKTEPNLTAHVSVGITDNGKDLIHVSGEAKVDREKQEASVSGVIQDILGEKEQSFQAYREDGKVIVKTDGSDTYRILEKKNWATGRFEREHTEPPVIVEHIGNIALGNIRELSTVENLPDGSKQVSLELTEDKLPIFADKAATMLFAKIAEHKQDAPAKISLPALQGDVDVEQVSFHASIDADNRIKSQEAQIHVSGSDAAGEKHELVLKVDVALSGFSQTKVEHINLTGKQVETLEEWHHPVWK
ncbi:hypothetical protein [Brevibacillus centrosporus]|uniref:hypothetical protein n=1 Tax=Brevibacillus centrosporus TaxID=54910 RepID=UPI003B02E5B4